MNPEFPGAEVHSIHWPAGKPGRYFRAFKIWDPANGYWPGFYDSAEEAEEAIENAGDFPLTADLEETERRNGE